MCGRGSRPLPFTIFTITYKVAVFTPAVKADTLPLFLLYPNVLCGLTEADTEYTPTPSSPTLQLPSAEATLIWEPFYTPL